MRDLYLVLAQVARARGEAEARVFEDAAAAGDAQRSEWVDQSQSALGKRRHCAAARRVVAEGGQAAIIGRRHLLSPAAIRAELERLTKRTGQKHQSPAGSAASELRAQLGLVGGGRR